MKTICFIRHGKSEQNSFSANDFNRELTERGIKDSREMGHRLAAGNFMADLIITSPAARARSTAELVAQELNYDVKNLQLEEDFYLCDVSVFQKTINELDEKINSLIIVGHNPGIHMAESYFAGEDRMGFPTCGLFIIEVESWHECGRGSCREIHYDFPGNVLH